MASVNDPGRDGIGFRGSGIKIHNDAPETETQASKMEGRDGGVVVVVPDQFSQTPSNSLARDCF